MDDYPGTSIDYTYNASGNLVTDGAKNLTIDYNSILNLPNRISTTGKNNYMFYHYTATGAKLVKHKGDNITHYIGNIVYENDKLSYIITEEGRLVAFGEGADRTFVNEYTLKDHLGNNRITFTGASLVTGIDIAQTTSYYPFGLVMVQKNENTHSGYAKNKYLYNGKELQDEFFESQKLDWLDYGARFYDPQIGRWHVVDALAEDYYDVTPYNYCNNNPISAIDPDGNGWMDVVHGALDVAGLVPGLGEIADGINAVAYLAEGDYGNAALSAAAMVPIAGAAATVVKFAKTADKVVTATKTTDKVVTTAKSTEKLRETAKTGQEAHRQIQKELKTIDPKTKTEVPVKLKDGTTVRKDAVKSDGTKVIIKPNTASGQKSAAKREAKMKDNGHKTETIYYDPKDPKYQPGSPSYIGPKK